MNEEKLRFIDEYRNKELLLKLIKKLKREIDNPIKIMEVCGTHTISISKFGIRRLLKGKVYLTSGPGCPVCVTPNEDIDWIIELCRKFKEKICLTVFGDIMRVPGSNSSLFIEKAKGANIRIVYSPIEAIEIAKKRKDLKIVFFGIGFETTAPSIAISLIEAKKNKLENFYLYSAHKLIPPALDALLSLGEIKLNGFILPGHVSTIIGSNPYRPILKKYGLAGVIAGFEPLDIIQALLILNELIKNKIYDVKIQYSRSVKPEGNEKAKKIMNNVFKECNSIWRGLGEIPNSGLELREEYNDMNAKLHFDINIPPKYENPACKCGEVLRGIIYPYECPLFAKACTPNSPIGPCMVSSEGACAAWYTYEDWKKYKEMMKNE
ncbi:MAG: hydrogenase formation protein HypD [Nitrososphaerota archaeon]